MEESNEESHYKVQTVAAAILCKNLTILDILRKMLHFIKKRWALKLISADLLGYSLMFGVCTLLHQQKLCMKIDLVTEKLHFRQNSLHFLFYRKIIAGHSYTLGLTHDCICFEIISNFCTVENNQCTFFHI